MVGNHGLILFNKLVEVWMIVSSCCHCAVVLCRAPVRRMHGSVPAFLLFSSDVRVDTRFVLEETSFREEIHNYKDNPWEILNNLWFL